MRCSIGVRLQVGSGPTRWEVHDLIDLDLAGLDPVTAGEIDRYVPRFEFLLHDLTQADEDALRALPLTSALRFTYWLFKVARGNPRLVHDLERWADEIRAGTNEPGSAEVLHPWMVYIYTVSETPAEDLYDFAEKLGPEAKETLMTTAEMLRDEGRAETVVKQMTVKFGPLPDTVLATVRAGTPEQLETWAIRLLDANTIDEVLH